MSRHVRGGAGQGLAFVSSGAGAGTKEGKNASKIPAYRSETVAAATLRNLGPCLNFCRASILVISSEHNAEEQKESRRCELTLN